jgi:hypothetical protein
MVDELFTVSHRVILYELTSEITRRCFLRGLASFASTANDRVLGWSKVDVKLQSRSFGARLRARKCLFASLSAQQQGGIEAVVGTRTGRIGKLTLRFVECFQ